MQSIQKVDQAKQAKTRASLTMNGSIECRKATSSAPMFMGKMQYPSTQTD